MDAISSTDPLSELRIVLLGRSGEVKSKVGNIILGKEVLSVKDQCERAEGLVNGRPVALINTPDLLDPELPDRKLFYQIERCVTLSAPGPHALLLVLEKGSFTEVDRRRLERILRSLSDEAFKYSVVLLIHGRKKINKLGNPVNEVVQKCGGRSHKLINTEEINYTQVTELMEKIEQMMEENGGGFLRCEMFKEPESAALGAIEGSLMGAEQKMERKQKPQARPREQQQMGNGEKDAENKHQISDCIRIVLVGKTGNGKSATGNTILQREEFRSGPSSLSVTTRCKKSTGKVAGRRVAVVDTPGLFDTEVTNEEVQQEIAKCISFLAPGPHVFLLVLQVGRITKEEKDTLQLIKSTFGKMAETFIIVIFTRGDDLIESIENYIKKCGSTIQNLIQDCGNRFHVFNNKDKNNHNQVPELLDKIDMMVKKNGGGCYTNEMFQEAELTIKKECERILREKEEEMQREKEVLKAKHEEEMKKMQSRMEEERLQEENERNRREKELNEKEEHLRRECEEWEKREQEDKERRDEEEKKKKEKQELEWVGEMDKIEKEKSRMKEEWKRREDEEKNRVEREEKQRQEMIEKQSRERKEFEEKQAEEKEKRDREEQERKNCEERERREWEQKMKDTEKEKKEIQEDMKKRAEEWKQERKTEQIKKEEEEKKRKQKEEQEIREWEEKQKKMRDEFEKEREQEKQRREKESRDKEEIERDLEEKKRQLKKQQEEWDKERKEEREKKYKEDKQRREDERKRLEKLQDKFEKEREAENQKRKMEDQARREREEKQRKEMEEGHKRKMEEIKRKHKDNARKQAEEFNDFKEKYERDFLALRLNLETSLKGNIENIKQLHEEQQKQIDELKAKSEKSCVIL